LTKPVGPEKSSPSGRIAELDGLRGLAILMVLLYHYVYKRVDPAANPGIEDALFFLRLGWSGVDLFFVLSGYLIGGILLDAKYSPRFFQTFFIRRICRIFPLYYSVLILFAIAERVLGTDVRFAWLLGAPLPIWSYATYMQNWVMAAYSTFGSNWMGATWSLAIEEQFYVTLPFLVRYCSRATLTAVLAAGVCLAPLLRLFFGIENYFSQYVLLPARADALSLGVLAALLCRVDWLGIREAHRRAFAYVGALVTVVGVSILGMRDSTSGGILHTWCALFYAFLLLICVQHKEGLPARLLRMRWLGWLGDRSYGIYMYHLILLGLCHGILTSGRPRLVDLDTAGTTTLALVLTLITAHLSWRYFEKPVVEWGRRRAY